MRNVKQLTEIAQELYALQKRKMSLSAESRQLKAELESVDSAPVDLIYRYLDLHVREHDLIRDLDAMDGKIRSELSEKEVEWVIDWVDQKQLIEDLCFCTFVTDENGFYVPLSLR